MTLPIAMHNASSLLPSLPSHSPTHPSTSSIQKRNNKKAILFLQISLPHSASWIRWPPPPPPPPSPRADSRVVEDSDLRSQLLPLVLLLIQGPGAVDPPLPLGSISGVGGVHGVFFTTETGPLGTLLRFIRILPGHCFFDLFFRGQRGRRQARWSPQCAASCDGSTTSQRGLV